MKRIITQAQSTYESFSMQLGRKARARRARHGRPKLRIYKEHPSKLAHALVRYHQRDFYRVDRAFSDRQVLPYWIPKELAQFAASFIFAGVSMHVTQTDGLFHTIHFGLLGYYISGLPFGLVESILHIQHVADKHHPESLFERFVQNKGETQSQNVKYIDSVVENFPDVKDAVTDWIFENLFDQSDQMNPDVFCYLSELFHLLDHEKLKDYFKGLSESQKHSMSELTYDVMIRGSDHVTLYELYELQSFLHLRSLIHIEFGVDLIAKDYSSLEDPRLSLDIGWMNKLIGKYSDIIANKAEFVPIINNLINLYFKTYSGNGLSNLNHLQDFVEQCGLNQVDESILIFFYKLLAYTISIQVTDQNNWDKRRLYWEAAFQLSLVNKEAQDFIVQCLVNDVVKECSQCESGEAMKEFVKNIDRIIQESESISSLATKIKVQVVVSLLCVESADHKTDLLLSIWLRESLVHPLYHQIPTVYRTRIVQNIVRRFLDHDFDENTGDYEVFLPYFLALYLMSGEKLLSDEEHVPPVVFESFIEVLKNLYESDTLADELEHCDQLVFMFFQTYFVTREFLTSSDKTSKSDFEIFKLIWQNFRQYESLFEDDSIKAFFLYIFREFTKSIDVQYGFFYTAYLQDRPELAQLVDQLDEWFNSSRETLF